MDRSADTTDDTPLNPAQRISRRDFVHINLGLLSLGSLSACTAPHYPLDPRQEFRLLRADDLLALHIRFSNLAIKRQPDGAARLVRIDNARAATLTVRLPGQHIAEQVFDIGNGAQPQPPVAAKIARPSQLTFALPEGTNSIPLTFAALLDWQALQSDWPREADTGLSDQSTQSVLELPAGLALTPPDGSHWRHATEPVVHAGRVELWHTRLVPTDGATALQVVIERLDTTGTSDMPGPISDADRRGLDGNTVTATTLMLSPMGGWLDVRGRFEPATAGDIQRWEQRTVAGQDQRVVIEKTPGRLYPFGHAATILEVTERQTNDPTQLRTGSPIAALRRQRFVVIKNPAMAYAPGAMPLRQLTITRAVSAPLSSDTSRPFFLLESGGAPFEFPFAGEDWDFAPVQFHGASVFVRDDALVGPDAGAVFADIQAAYGDGVDAAPGRRVDLNGQSVTVAPFQALATNAGLIRLSDGLGEPVTRERVAGDTTMVVLGIEFGGVLDVGADPVFRCRTDALEARLPALSAFLPDEINRGWFKLRDPNATDNVGEVFAEALARGARIPMHFDQQANLSGGVAAPSFNVDGLSRRYGPVGNAARTAAGEPVDPSFFAGEAAELLGGFPLADFLKAVAASESPAIPQITFAFGRPQDEQEDDTEVPYLEASVGLNWRLPLDPGGPAEQPKLVELLAVREGEELKTKLELAVKLIATYGKPAKPATENKKDAPTTNAEQNANTPSKFGAGLEVSGKLSHFQLALNVDQSSRLQVKFKSLSVKIGPPRKKKKPAPEPEPTPQDTTRAAAEANGEAGNSGPIGYALDGIVATGALSFVQTIVDVISELPKPPPLPTADEANDYPAKLPGTGKADLAVTLGPFEAPKFEVAGLEASNVAVSIGLGFNFLPRGGAVPPHVFSLAVASADKPVTLLAAPWGGITHLEINFSQFAITGFQFGLGAIGKYKPDFKVAKAKCEASLAVILTSWYEDDQQLLQVDVVFRLAGTLEIWSFYIKAQLMLVGTPVSGGFVFSGSLRISVQISFFTFEARLSFSQTVIGNETDTGEDTAPRDAAPSSVPLTQTEWLEYRAAFASAA